MEPLNPDTRQALAFRAACLSGQAAAVREAIESDDAPTRKLLHHLGEMEAEAQAIALTLSPSGSIETAAIERHLADTAPQTPAGGVRQ